MRSKRRIAKQSGLMRVLSLVLSFALCVCAFPARALSIGEPSRLCGHVHGDGTCAYSAGAPCTHQHDESCYPLIHRCTHVCDEACSEPCGHVCGTECYEKELLCTHEHDEACGYAAPSESGCDHICHIVSFDGYTPGTPLITYAAPDGAAYGDILNALPETLPARLTCAEGVFDVPVSWNCEEFTGEAGIYAFCAELADAYCDYTVPDDPATTDIDESAVSPYCDLPSAEVTLASPADPVEQPQEPARGHICEVTGFLDNDPSEVFAVAQFNKGRTLEELLSKVLPRSLAVTYACDCALSETVPPDGDKTGESDDAQPVAAADELPVTWECAGFDPNKTGDYIFTVKALPAYPFTYLQQDDPATIDVDESLPPSILVRVYDPSAPTEKFTVCYGVLNSDKVHVRSGPGTIFESVAQFDTDTPVTVTGQCDHWYRVDIATWTGAFIDKSLITILEEQTEAAAPVTGKLNADEVKIRKGPDREYDILAVLRIGAPMTVLGRCGNWYYVSTEDIPKGYVWREYVTIDPPVPVEEPTCICAEHCIEGHVNADCPVCAAHPDDCAVRYIAEGYPRTGRVNTENCEVLVGAVTLHLNLDTALTLYNEAEGLYEFSSDEIEKGYISTDFVTIDPLAEYKCICASACTETACDARCPVCAAEGWGACAIKELSEQTISAVAEDGSTITISGSLPFGATASVSVVPLETAAEFVSEDAKILFAYDIKILVAGVEWQPDENVRVSITPPPEAPIVSDVAVTHVTEDKDTGAVTTNTIADVSTTLSDETAAQPGAVEFAAEGFSIYIGTEGSDTSIILTPGAGYAFYSSSGCETETEISGTIFVTSLPHSIYLKLNDDYVMGSIAIENEGGTDSDATATESGGIWTLTFPDTLTLNQIITVTTTYTGVNAPGGTITSSSTAAQVAAMFDAAAAPGISETDNVAVSVNGGTFSVEVKNNILLKGTITVDSGANVILTSEGNYTVKRDVASFQDNLLPMFQVSGELSLGAGTDIESSITYSFSGVHDTETYTLPHEIPEIDGEKITNARVNTNHEVTMTGTLTIDGGANFITPIHAADKTYPVCSTASTGSIVNSTGKLMLWDGVTLQNNYNTVSNDGLTYAGVRIQSGSFYMYGGKITQCSTKHSTSMSDGGGVCFLDGNAYFFGGEITECCGDNGAAVAIFGSGTSPTAYYLGTLIHDNLSVGDSGFPGQACSAYAGAAVRMYAGSIIDNKNAFDDTNADADYDMKPSGENSGVNLFGGTIGKLGVVKGATINVYDCQISTVYGAGALNYIVGYSVTIPDCMPKNTTDTVRLTIQTETGGSYSDYGTIDKTGNETSWDLELTLLEGDYRFIVESTSMQKIYSAIVTGEERQVTATPISRTITVPVIASRTSNSITLIPAGNGNLDANGEILYGFSTTNDVAGVPQSGPGAWQSDSSFSTGLAGTLYFFVKACATSLVSNSFPESTSSGLSAYFDAPASVVIDSLDYVTMDAGRVQTFTITTIPTNYDIERIIWTITGTDNTGTSITRQATGRGSLRIAANELASTITLKVELLDKDRVPVVNDTVTIDINPYAYIDPTHLEVPSVLSASLLNGEAVTASGVYQWFRDGNAITGQTGDTYTTTAIDANKVITVQITGTDSTVYTSAPVTIIAPQLNVGVPIDMVVTVSADGACSVPNGQKITNSSAVPVYVTNVSYTWVTNSAGNDADDLFGDYTAVEASLPLNGATYTFKGATPDVVYPTAAAGTIGAKNGVTPGELALAWTFTLGTGNHLNLAPAIGESIHVATVAYTIDYTPPTQ